MPAKRPTVSKCIAAASPKVVFVVQNVSVKTAIIVMTPMLGSRLTCWFSQKTKIRDATAKKQNVRKNIANAMPQARSVPNSVHVKTATT